MLITCKYKIVISVLNVVCLLSQPITCIKIFRQLSNRETLKLCDGNLGVFSFYNTFIMETFKDCSTHVNNVDLLILEKLEEENLISITTNNEEDFNIIWLNKEEALKLAYSIISMVNEL